MNSSVNRRPSPADWGASVLAEWPAIICPANQRAPVADAINIHLN